jgi:hypothetical protein
LEVIEKANMYDGLCKWNNVFIWRWKNFLWMQNKLV